MDSYNYDVNNGYYQGRTGYSYDPTQQAYQGQGHGFGYGPTQQPYVGQGQGMNYYPGNGSSFHVEVREKVSTYVVRNQHPPADCYYNTDRSMPSMPGSLLNDGRSQYTMPGSQYNMDGSHCSGYGQVQYSAVNCPSSSSAGYRLPCDPHVPSLDSIHPIQQQNFDPNAISNIHAWNGNSGNEGMMGFGIGATGRNGDADGSGWNRPTDVTSFCSTSTLVPSTLNQQGPLVENLSIASTMSSNQQATSHGNPSKQITPGNIFIVNRIYSFLIIKLGLDKYTAIHQSSWKHNPRMKTHFSHRFSSRFFGIRVQL